MKINRKPSLWDPVLMTVMALLISFAFQGTRGLYETSEGRYAEVAREMMEGGDYLEPTMGYKPHWTKPPLTYWATVAGMGLLGCNEWGARLFNSLALFATVLLVAHIGGTLWDRKTGLIAGFVYASSLYPVLAAHVLTTDTLLTLWEVWAVLCYVKALYSSSPRKAKRWMMGMWFLFGLGFLTKGPPALLPLLPMAVWSIWHKHASLWSNPLGAVVFLVVGLSCYGVVILRHPDLLSYFLFVEAVEKVGSGTVQNSEWYKPFILYLPALTLGAGPWFYLGVKTLRQRGLFKPGVLWGQLKEGSRGGFLVLWLLLPLAIFFLVRGRLILYVLPLYAPVSLALARGISGTGEHFVGLRRVMIVAGITGVVILGIKGAASLFPSKHNMAHLYEACRAVGVEGRRFVVFDEPRLYGLQFYLNGRLERTSPGSKEPWADFSVEEALAGIKGSAPPPPYVFVSDKGKSSGLRSILQGMGISFQEVQGSFWSLFVTRPALPPEGRGLNLNQAAAGETFRSQNPTFPMHA
jgi:4-amino-4-deoxy-L-arabinose transferase-like glycosyltransferase